MSVLAAAVLSAAAALAAPEAAPASPPTAAPTQFARIARESDGSPGALQLAIVTYAPEDGAQDFTVDLISAIHVGDKAYYEELNERFREYDALLYEMIIPGEPDAPENTAPGLNFISGTQIGMKNMLGLEFQLDQIDYGAVNFVHADLTSEMLAQSMEDRGESLYVYFWRLVFAAIEDYAEDPLALDDWQMLSNMLLSNEDDALKISIAYEMVSATKNGDILGGENGSAVIAARNDHAVGVLKEQIAVDAKRIGIFYGVGHMADFEQRLTNELALSKTGIEWVDAWRFTSGTPAASPDERERARAAPLSGSRQLILVTTPEWDSSRGTMRVFARSQHGWESAGDATPVVIGRAGAAWGIGLHPPQAGPQKREGDGRSPAGAFAIGAAFGYADAAGTALPYEAMDANDWCIDVSASPLYNQIVDAANVGSDAVAGSTEPMRRDLHANGDQRYEVGFVIEHNAGSEPDAGSCIFGHVWKSADSPTAGCTAMNELTMRGLLAWLRPEARPVFVLLPQPEYERLRAAWDLPKLGRRDEGRLPLAVNEIQPAADDHRRADEDDQVGQDSPEKEVEPKAPEQ